MNVIAAGELLFTQGIPAPSVESLKDILAQVFGNVSVNERGLVEVMAENSSIMFAPSASSTVAEGYMENVHPQFVEEAEIEPLGNHEASLMVAAMGAEAAGKPQAIRSFLQIYREAISCLVEVYPVAGMVIEGTVFGPKYLREVTLEPRGIELVAPMWLWEGGEGVTAYTYGMKNLQLPEVQVDKYSGKSIEVFSAILVAIEQLITGDMPDNAKRERWLVDRGVEAMSLHL